MPEPGFDAGPPPSLGLLGWGRAARAIDAECRAAGLAPAWIWTRAPVEDPPPMHLFGPLSGHASSLLDVDLVIVAVRDDALPAVGAALLPLLKTGAVALHLSGARPGAALGIRDGTEVGSFHPLQSFTAAGPQTSCEPLPAYVVGIEGSARAQDLGRWLATRLGHESVVLHAEQKARWHAAAVLAANSFVALQAVAVRVMVGAGLDQDGAWRVLRPLVAGVARNLQQGGPRVALTGPVVRGDLGTVENNLRALAEDPRAAEIYRALGLEALALAASPSEAVEALLHASKTSDSAGSSEP